MQMGCLMGWIGWVELVVVRGGSNALEWKRKEFWNEGGRSCGNWHEESKKRSGLGYI
jgi:hypothetical protein